MQNEVVILPIYSRKHTNLVQQASWSPLSSYLETSNLILGECINNKVCDSPPTTNVSSDFTSISGHYTKNSNILL